MSTWLRLRTHVICRWLARRALESTEGLRRRRGGGYGLPEDGHGKAADGQWRRRCILDPRRLAGSDRGRARGASSCSALSAQADPGHRQLNNSLAEALAPAGGPGPVERARESTRRDARRSGASARCLHVEHGLAPTAEPHQPARVFGPAREATGPDAPVRIQHTKLRAFRGLRRPARQCSRSRDSNTRAGQLATSERQCSAV